MCGCDATHATNMTGKHNKNMPNVGCLWPAGFNLKHKLKCVQKIMHAISGESYFFVIPTEKIMISWTLFCFHFHQAKSPEQGFLSNINCLIVPFSAISWLKYYTRAESKDFKTIIVDGLCGQNRDIR